MVNALRRNIKQNISVALLLILTVLLCLTACVDKSTETGLITITIDNRISSASKTVAYDGSLTNGTVDINAYRVLIAYEAGATIADSGVQSETEFVLSGIVPGTYEFTVQGIISGAGNDYVIAENTESHTVTANARIAVALKDAAPGTAGDITLKVYAPLTGEYDPTHVRFTITGDGWKKSFVIPGNSEAKYTGSGTDEKGTYWTYLVRSTAGIKAGFCTIGLEIEPADSGEKLSCFTSGVLFSGLPASGIIDIRFGGSQIDAPVIEIVDNSPNKQTHDIGDTVMFDGIECVIAYDAGSEQQWGRYLLVDKNHNLAYYNNEAEETGYEWGAYGTAVYGTSMEIGSGLSNSEICLANSKCFKPDAITNGTTIWSILQKVRNEHSKEWFIPSSDEYEIINDTVRGLLLNICTNGAYWSSDESSQYMGRFFFFTTEELGSGNKYNDLHSRLACYATDEDLNASTATIRIMCSTPETEIRYTVDGSEPDESSRLYSGEFSVTSSTTVKAKAYKTGAKPSKTIQTTVTISTELGSLPVPEIDFEYNEGNATGKLILENRNAYDEYSNVVLHILNPDTSERTLYPLTDSSNVVIADYPLIRDRQPLVFYASGNSKYNRSERIDFDIPCSHEKPLSSMTRYQYNTMNTQFLYGAYGNGTNVIIGPGSTLYDEVCVRYLSKGEAWNGSYAAVTSPDFSDTELLNICYGNGKFVIITKSDGVYYSTDGKNWTHVEHDIVAGFGRRIKDITFGNGMFVIVCENSTYMTYSRDAINWETTNGFDNRADIGRGQLNFANGRFIYISVARVSNEAYVFTSTNGIDWEKSGQFVYKDVGKIEAPIPNRVVYADGNYVTFYKHSDNSGNKKLRAYYSKNLKDWNYVTWSISEGRDFSIEYMPCVYNNSIVIGGSDNGKTAVFQFYVNEFKCTYYTTSWSDTNSTAYSVYNIGSDIFVLMWIKDHAAFGKNK